MRTGNANKWSHLCILAGFLLASLIPTTADAGDAQFLFVVDDARGMQSADPDRLAIFAVQTLLSMVDDTDQAIVSGVHGGTLAPGELAAYSAPNSPCRTMLQRAGDELNAIDREGTQQVMVILGRGVCTDGNPAFQGFLDGLSSFQDDRLQVSMIRWPSEGSARGWRTLTENTGGLYAEVELENPTRFFEPFARVLSRARGADAVVLGPGRDVIPAHSGALRVHLMAIGPDVDRDLSLDLTPLEEGAGPASQSSVEAGRHQHEDGMAFRYARTTYEPGDSPLRVEVTGAGTMRRVEITRRAIVINEAVHFEVDSARIRPESSSLLDELAEVLNGAPWIRRVEVQGHTDHSGSAEYNLGLSGRRAEAVRQALVERGVQSGRLTSQGYGFQEPIVEIPPGGRESPAAAAQNRRVDFVILDQGEPPAGSADGDWVVLAIPEYRLQMDIEMTLGACGESSVPVSFVPVDGEACVHVTLNDHRGQPVTFDLAGAGTRAEVDHEAPDGEPRAVRGVRQGVEPRFQVELSGLAEGDHVLRPRISLGARGQSERILTGAARTVQASSREARAEPGSIDLGEILPGTEHYHSLELQGNFPTTDGRLRVADAESLPSCLRFELSGVPSGESQPLTAGQTFTVAVHVAPNCAPESASIDIDGQLHLAFSTDPGSQPIPTVILPLTGTLTQDLEVPEALQVRVHPGQRAIPALELVSNHRQDLPMQVVVPDSNEHQRWSSPARHLSLQAEDEALVLPVSGDERSSVPLVVEAHRCCAGGDYRTQVALMPGVPGASPILVDVEVEVPAAGWWTCWGPRVLWTLLVLLLLALLFYLWSVYRSSFFLDRRRLANSLAVLHWDEMNDPAPATRLADQVRQIVTREMTFLNRLKAFLRANPLTLGLPGREYYETVEFSLQPSSQVQRSRLVLLAERDHQSRIRQEPRQGLGRCFASARGGLTLYAVPGEGGRIGAFTMAREFDDFGMDDEFRPTLERLRRRTDLLREHSDREPGDFAGWRIG